MTDQGLRYIVEGFMKAKTKGDAKEILEQCSNTYKRLAADLLDRLTFARTVNQNNFSHVWYSEIGRQLGETPLEVRCRAKLDIGCTILCRDDPEYLEACKLAMGHLDRETRLKKIMPYWPVTRLMNTAQKNEYLDTFERQHRGLGLHLSQPKDAA